VLVTGVQTCALPILSIEIKKYQDKIDLADELKSKFVRFNIDTNKSLDKDSDVIYNILKKDNNGYKIDNKLIIEHNIEIDNKMKQLDNEFIRLKMTFNDDLHDLYLQKNNKLIIEYDDNLKNKINKINNINTLNLRKEFK
jgi:hypothetical protein